MSEQTKKLCNMFWWNGNNPLEVYEFLLFEYGIKDNQDDVMKYLSTIM